MLNLLVAYGIYGLAKTPPGGQTGPRLISYCGLIGVGICSAGYHMTLKYHTQMCMALDPSSPVVILSNAIHQRMNYPCIF